MSSKLLETLKKMPSATDSFCLIDSPRETRKLRDSEAVTPHLPIDSLKFTRYQRPPTTASPVSVLIDFHSFAALSGRACPRSIQPHRHVYTRPLRTFSIPGAVP